MGSDYSQMLKPSRYTANALIYKCYKNIPFSNTKEEKNCLEYY